MLIVAKHYWLKSHLFYLERRRALPERQRRALPLLGCQRKKPCSGNLGLRRRLPWPWSLYQIHRLLMRGYLGGPSLPCYSLLTWWSLRHRNPNMRFNSEQKIVNNYEIKFEIIHCHWSLNYLCLVWTKEKKKKKNPLSLVWKKRGGLKIYIVHIFNLCCL